MLSSHVFLSTRLCGVEKTTRYVVACVFVCVNVYVAIYEVYTVAFGDMWFHVFLMWGCLLNDFHSFVSFIHPQTFSFRNL